ncbi:DMT family transporter [Aureimonas sp. OT7]|uniref:DMT family transporter n=1 Tax=Aureimonas sp. OT7 TaxID=2816454 RepID=UPI001FEF1DEF|nr:DMT family transporter [Aureimonas sp. OT7]
MSIARHTVESASAADNLRASLMMIGSTALFVVNDTLTKIIMKDMSAAQVIAIRGAMVCLLLFAIAWHRKALPSLSALSNPYLIIRTLADAGTTFLFMLALANMPIANASAIYQALPLVVTVGAALFLGEAVGWRRWTATFVGFTGVIIIVRPGMEGFSIYSIAVLLSVVTSAARDLATRRMPKGLSSITVAAITAATITMLGAALTPFTGVASVTAMHFGLMAAAAVLLSAGYVVIVAAMRGGDVGFVAPFRYTALLFAIILGYLVFGELPDFWSSVGSVIVVLSGLYTIYRERRRRTVKAIKAQVH